MSINMEFTYFKEMEKAKRIIKIVLFIIVIPIFIAQASQNGNISAYEEAVRNISEDYNDGYSSIVDVALRPATQIAGSTFLLSPIMLIVAGVLTSKNKKKPFDLLVAGILLLSIFINNFSTIFNN